jgi:hypothetical protein
MLRCIPFKDIFCCEELRKTYKLGCLSECYEYESDEDVSDGKWSARYFKLYSGSKLPCERVGDSYLKIDKCPFCFTVLTFKTLDS